MFARVVVGTVKPHLLDRSIAILEGQIRPHLLGRPGCRGWELFIDRETGRFQAITRWASLVEAQGASRDGFTDRAGLLAAALAGEVEQMLYEVRP